MKANRFNNGKLKWSLLHWPTVAGLVRVLMFGSKKYSANNWMKGLPVTEISESMIRHLIAYLDGEDNDPESGLPHVDHIQCNAMFLAFMSKLPKWDDRLKNTNDGSESKNNFR